MPGITEAVAWLLDLPKPHLPAQVFRRARLQRLIVGHPATWRVNRNSVVRVLGQCRPHSAPPSAVVLYGLGELLARTTGGPALVIPRLASLSRRQVQRLLEEIRGIAAAQIPKKPHMEIGSRDMLFAPCLNETVWRHAESYLAHPPLARPRLFGLDVVIETLLTTHPQALGEWLTQDHPTAINQTVLAYLATRLIFSDEPSTLHRQLLLTKRPILQAMAIASLASNHWNNRLMPFGVLVELSHDMGLSPLEAFALAIVSAKNTCLRRRQTRDRFADMDDRLRQIVKHPEKAPGGISYATGEIERLTAMLPTLDAAKHQSELAVDQLILDIAQSWPSEGITSDLIIDLTHAFGADAAELSTRLFQSLGAVPGAIALLDGVINDMSKMLGLNVTQTVFEESFRPSAEEFDTACQWTSLALSLRYTADQKGVGWRTSQLLAPMAKAASTVMDAPYAAVRWSQQYASALTRQACSILLAIEVACGSNEHERAARSRLMELALVQAMATLSRDRPDINTHGWTDRLASACTGCMRLGYAPDQRALWGSNLRLPVYVRALAVWSDPELIRSDPARAEALFLQGASRKNSHNDDRAISQALSLLDLALATGARHTADDITNLAISIWPRAYRSWQAIAGDRWSEFHHLLLDALVKEGNARQQILNDPQWVQSHCIDAIKKNQSILLN